jgi:hypothetical protein
MVVDIQATSKFGLADAASAVRAYSDQTHRFWGYFQVASAGTAAFAWAGHSPATWSYQNRHVLLVVLLVAYISFSIANNLLLQGSQRAARDGHDAIADFKRRHPAEIDGYLGKIVLLNKPVKPSTAGLLHLAIIIAVCASVLISPLGWGDMLFSAPATDPVEGYS